MSARPAASLLLLSLMAVAACSRAPVAPSANPSARVLDAMAGQWASDSDTAKSGACSRISVLVGPTGPGAARVEFGATCGSTSTSGVASGTVSGTTLAWTSEYFGTLTFTAGDVQCTSSTPTGGTLQLVDSTTATVTYSLRVCGVPVNGTATLALAR